MCTRWLRKKVRDTVLRFSSWVYLQVSLLRRCDCSMALDARSVIVVVWMVGEMALLMEFPRSWSCCAILGGRSRAEAGAG